MAADRSDGPRSRPAREDEEALRDLSLAYAAAADARDGEALVALFADDGVLMVPRYPVDLRPLVARAAPDGIRQVAEMLCRYDRTFHLVSDARYVVEGERASGEVRCVAHHVTAAAGAVDAGEAGGAAGAGEAGGAAGAGEPVGAGSAGPAGTDMVWFIVYRDQYLRCGTAWRLARRELHLLWVEEHPVSVLGAPSE
jgi:ketosteroid isomerase-like protein